MRYRPLKRRNYTHYQKTAHQRRKYNPSKNKFTVKRSYNRFKKSKR